MRTNGVYFMYCHRQIIPGIYVQRENVDRIWSQLTEYLALRGAVILDEDLNSWFQTFALFRMLYSFLLAIHRRLYFMCWRFGTLSLFHLPPLMKLEQTECSETSAYKIQTPGKRPKEGIKKDLNYCCCRWLLVKATHYFKKSHSCYIEKLLIKFSLKTEFMCRNM